MSNLEPKALFIKALEEIKRSKKFSFATISRLTSISIDKIYNVINNKSTPKLDDIHKLLVVFPEYYNLFADLEGLKYSPDNPGYDFNVKDIVSILNEKIAMYEETKLAQRETIEAQKEEIKRLREIVELQNILLKKMDQGEEE